MSDSLMVRFNYARNVEGGVIVCVPNGEEAEEKFRKKKLDEGYQAVVKRARSPRFHNLVMRIIRDLFENQETYEQMEVFRTIIKIKCGWVYEEPIIHDDGKGNVWTQWVPKPTDWSSCGEDEFREFFDKLKPIVWERLGQDAWDRYRL